jgi:hypothetical protein
VSIEEHFDLVVEGEDAAAASRSALALADMIAGADCVVRVSLNRLFQDTMDLGTIVSVVVSSGATLALAQGIAAWLRGRRGVTLRIEKDRTTGSIKTEVIGIDPESALRIVELIRD